MKIDGQINIIIYHTFDSETSKGFIVLTVRDAVFECLCHFLTTHVSQIESKLPKTSFET